MIYINGELMDDDYNYYNSDDADQEDFDIADNSDDDINNYILCRRQRLIISALDLASPKSWRNLQWKSEIFIISLWAVNMSTKLVGMQYQNM